MRYRFIAKRWGKGWRVYDTERGSWPINTPWTGSVVQDHKTEASAQAEADRLNEMV